MPAITASLFARSAVLAAAFAIPATLLRAEPLQLMFGDPAARHATVTFAPDTGGAEAVVISTRRAGAPGSRLALSVDHAATPLIDRILTADDCRFDDGGSRCAIAVPGDSPDYRALVTAFKRGLTLHIDITNAGSMEMSEDVSLKGFTKAYGRL